MYRQYSYSKNSCEQDPFQLFLALEKELLKTLKVIEINTEEFIPIVYRIDPDGKNFDPLDFRKFRYYHFKDFEYSEDGSCNIDCKTISEEEIEQAIQNNSKKIISFYNLTPKLKELIKEKYPQIIYKEIWGSIWDLNKSDKKLSTYPTSFYKIPSKFKDEISTVKNDSKTFDFLRTLPNFSNYCEEYIKEQKERKEDKEDYIYCCKLGKVVSTKENEYIC